MTDLDYAVKAILDSAHERVQAEITAAVADGADLYERVTAALSPPTDETAKLRREVAELKAKLKNGKAGEVATSQPRPQPPASADLADIKAMLYTLIGRAQDIHLSVPVDVTAEMPEQEAPNVYNAVTVPELQQPNVYVAAPDVTVNTPAVTVQAADPVAPVVNVTNTIEAQPEAKANVPQDVRVVEMVARRLTASKKVKRNNLNLVTQIDENAIEEDA